MKIKSYKDLKVWQKAIKLAIDVFNVTKKYPREEVYGMTLQTRRAGVAIPANIAEGYARGHLKEYIQFLRIAFSSGVELETHLLIANKVEMFKDRDFKLLNRRLDEIMKMLNVLMDKLKKLKTRTWCLYPRT